MAHFGHNSSYGVHGGGNYGTVPPLLHICVACHFDRDPDLGPAYHFYPDPDPTF